MPMMVTMRSDVVFGLASAALMRLTTLGKQGRSTVPWDTSLASS